MGVATRRRSIGGGTASIVIGLTLALGSLVLVGLSVGATPAAAHSAFDRSEPADGAEAAEPVDLVVIHFTGPVEPAGEGFVVLDPSGAVRAPDTVVGREADSAWHLGFDPPLADGAVGVRWTVAASDSHTISGSFSFVSPASAAAEDSGPTAAEEGTNDPTATDGGAPVATDPTPAAVDTPVAADPTPAPLTQGAGTDEALTAFLDDTDTAPPMAPDLVVAGRMLEFGSAMVALGGLVFAATVLGRHAKDAYVVLRLVGHAGTMLVLGAATELVAQVAVIGGSWSSVTSIEALEQTLMGPFGAALGLRLLAGLWLMVAAEPVVMATVPAAAPAHDLALVGSATGSGGAAPTTGTSAWKAIVADFGSGDGGGPVPTADLHPPTIVTPARILAGLTLLVSFTFDGHTSQVGTHWMTAVVDMIHVAAGAVWAGGVVTMATLLWRRHWRGAHLGAMELAVRFSVVAVAALVLAGMAGSVLAAMILDDLAELTGTPWGRLLLAKVALVVVAAVIGLYNHVFVVARLNRGLDQAGLTARLRRTVTVEALVIAAVIVATAFLVGAKS